MSDGVTEALRLCLNFLEEPRGALHSATGSGESFGKVQLQVGNQ